MQTQTYLPPVPMAPDPPRQRRTNWTPTLVAGGVGLLVAIALVVLLLGRSSELASAREELRSEQATVTSQRIELESQARELDAVRDDLSSATASLSSTRSDLRSANSALNVTIRCATKTLEAWYSTTGYSYTVTGYALERAIRSSPCRVVHSADVNTSASYA
jgi:hypothetical protein